MEHSEIQTHHMLALKPAGRLVISFKLVPVEDGNSGNRIRDGEMFLWGWCGEWTSSTLFIYLWNLIQLSQGGSQYKTHYYIIQY